MSVPPIETSAALRARVLAARRAVPAAERARLGAGICARWLALHAHVPPARWSGARVGLYRALATHAELDLAPLERELARRGARLHYPRVPGPDARAARAMDFVEVTDAAVAHAWVVGAYGIAEPAPQLAACDPTSLDLIIVPGVAFGPAGERLGLGGGFYDRYLPRAPQAFRAALAFELQLVPALAREPWDQALDLVVTETRETSVQRVFDTLARK